MTTIEREFFLHSKTIAEGRDAIAKFLTAQLPNAPQHFPPAAPGLLNGFLANAKLHADNWTKYADGGASHTQMIFNEAVAASSWTTVAAEIAIAFHWVSRVDYAPTDSERAIITPEWRTFARDVNRLLNIMYDLTCALRDSDRGDEERDPATVLRLQRRQRLQQALYLAELGVKVTCPENYSYHHPEANKWLSLRSSVRRQLAEAMFAAADADDALAKQYRGKVQY
jgi:hypothetical protein